MPGPSAWVVRKRSRSMNFCTLPDGELEARFPRHAGELPPAAVKFVAGQLKVDPVLFAAYGWSGRTAEYHRAQIRAALGFR